MTAAEAAQARLPGLPVGSKPDLTAAAKAILAGACLSIGPTGGLATRAPYLVSGNAARAFVDEARRVLRPVLDDAEARAALLRILHPWPRGWGSPGGCGIVAVLWSPTLPAMPPGGGIAPGHRVDDVARFVANLRREALEGPTWADIFRLRRFTARVHTGAFLADIDALDDTLARLS